MSKTSWLIGSTRFTAKPSVYINDNVEVQLPVGAYYLRDPNPARSYLEQLRDAFDGPLVDPSVTIGRDRRLRIAAAAAFTISFDAILLPILGFTFNVVQPTTLAVADTPSRLLWSPGWEETPELTPRGVAGVLDRVEALTASQSKRTIHTTILHTAKIQAFRWTQIPSERVWSPGVEAGEPGQYARFRDEVLAPNFRWKLYPSIDERPSDWTPVAWTEPLGPYKRRGKLDPKWYQRQFRSDVLVKLIRIECAVVDEYTD